MTGNETTLKLCDFGSSFRIAEPEEISPNFDFPSSCYRAPEICESLRSFSCASNCECNVCLVLGLPYDFGIDAWSVAVTLYETYTGKIMFRGKVCCFLPSCWFDADNPTHFSRTIRCSSS